MATKVINIDNFQLRSTWSDSFYPSTATKTVAVNLSDIPTDSVVRSATLSIKTNGPGDSKAAVGNVSYSVTNDHTTGSTNGAVNVAGWLSAIPATLNIVFSFQAYSGYARGTGGSGGVYCSFSSIVLTIEYELPNSSGTLSTKSVTAGSGTSITLTVNPTNQAYSHRVIWSFGKQTNTQELEAGIEKPESSWSIPLTFCSEIPNSTSGIGSAQLITLNGDTRIGSTQKYTFTVNVPADIVPSAGALNAKPVYTTSVSESWSSVYVQGYTAIGLELPSVDGSYGSTITSVTFTGWGDTLDGTADNGTYKATTEIMNTSGQITLTATITDSRGRTATKTRTISVLSSAAPRISSVSAVRCLSDGTRSDLGTCALVTVNFAISEVGDNTAHTSAYYRETGTSSYTNAETEFANGEPFIIGAGDGTGDGALSADKSYDIMVVISDDLGGHSEAVVMIPTATYVFHFRDGGKAIGVGRAASDTDNTLTINENWKVYIGGVDMASYHKHLTYNGMVTGDFDTYLTPGTYDVTVSSLGHQPVARPGQLIVMSVSGDEHTDSFTLAQVFITRDANAVYMRQYTRSTQTFSAWHKMMFEGDDVSKLGGTLGIPHGGTGATTIDGAKSALGMLDFSHRRLSNNNSTAANATVLEVTNLNLEDGDMWEGTVILGANENTDYKVFFDNDTTVADYRSMMRYGGSTRASQCALTLANADRKSITHFTITKFGTTVLMEGESLRGDNVIADFVICRDTDGSSMQIVPEKALTSGHGARLMMRKIYQRGVSNE